MSDDKKEPKKECELCNTEPKNQVGPEYIDENGVQKAHYECNCGKTRKEAPKITDKGTIYLQD